MGEMGEGGGGRGGACDRGCMWTGRSRAGATACALRHRAMSREGGPWLWSGSCDLQPLSPARVQWRRLWFTMASCRFSSVDLLCLDAAFKRSRSGASSADTVAPTESWSAASERGSGEPWREGVETPRDGAEPTVDHVWGESGEGIVPRPTQVSKAVVGQARLGGGVRRAGPSARGLDECGLGSKLRARRHRPLAWRCVWMYSPPRGLAPHRPTPPGPRRMPRRHRPRAARPWPSLPPPVRRRPTPDWGIAGGHACTLRRAKPSQWQCIPKADQPHIHPNSAPRARMLRFSCGDLGWQIAELQT